MTGLPSPIVDIVPNPASAADGLAKHVALVGKDGVVVLDLESGNVSDAFGGPSTSGTSVSP